MSNVEELIKAHAELKSKIAARTEEKKRRKAEFEEGLEEDLFAAYGDVDADLAEVRAELLELVKETDGWFIQTEVGQVTFEERRLSWEVKDLAKFASWVLSVGRADDLLDVKKSNVNKLCEGAVLGGFKMPDGVGAKMTPVLEVKLARPEEV